MKRTLAIILSSALIISAVFLAACSGKWYQPKDNMSDEWWDTQEAVLEEHLDILKEDPENLDSIFEVAYRYQQLGEFKNAVKYYEECLEMNPNHIVCLNNIADIYEHVEEYDTAAGYIMRLFELTPTMEETVKDTVDILLKAGDIENAKRAVDYYEEQMVTGEDEEADALQYEVVIDPLREDIATAEAEDNSEESQ